MESYEQDLMRQTDIIEWCKRWTLGAILLVGGNYSGMTPLVEIITLPRQRPSPIRPYKRSEEHEHERFG